MHAFPASLGAVVAVSACVPEGPVTTREETLAEVKVTPEVEPGVMTQPFRDEFARAELGPDYLALGAAWGLQGGRLCAEGAKNRGVWLRKKLPMDVRIELDAVALSDEGDLKVELFGDGRSGAASDTYDDATGYLAILGGWNNSLHVLARLDEHGDDRISIPVEEHGDDARTRRVAPLQSYRFKFERRQGNILTWYVNGSVFLELTDPEPLVGPGHQHFGFNDWAAPVCFDNLEITPL